MGLSIALAASFIVQFAAAALALWMIRLTGLRVSWILIALALLLMVARRVLPLVHFASKAGQLVSVVNDLLGLAISLCMLAGVIGIASIFRERREAEENVRRLLDEKDRMLKEVHHRIKNNMGVIGDLLAMEAADAGDDRSGSILADAAGRVRSMGVLYDKLYRAGRFEDSSLDAYVRALVDEVIKIFPRSSSVRFAIRIEEIMIPPARLSPIGIIVNELITNSMKYAFEGVTAPTISILVEKDAFRLRLVYEDNGRGLPESFSLGAQDGFGMQLVEALTSQLGGSLRVEPHRGARFVIEFAP